MGDIVHGVSLVQSFSSMILLMDYLTQRDIALVMQKMEAVTFSRFRQASKRLYRIADETENLSVMVDRRLILYTEIFCNGTLKGTVKRLRCNFEEEWRIEKPIIRNPSIQLNNLSPFIGFTFRQLEIVSCHLSRERDYSILKDCKWKNTTLITNTISTSLFEVVQPKELVLGYVRFYHVYKPLPISIKKMFNYESIYHLLDIHLLQNVEHVIYYHPPRFALPILIDSFFEYSYNWKLNILEIRSDWPYTCPIALTVEGAVNYIERMALEEIHPQFQNLPWEMVDSSVKYFTKSVCRSSEPGKKFNITLTKRVEYKGEWVQIVLTLKSIGIWMFDVNVQMQCL